METVVSVGAACSAAPVSPKPTTVTLAGTRSPAARAALSAASAIWSFAAKIAVGGGFGEQTAGPRARPLAIGEVAVDDEVGRQSRGRHRRPKAGLALDRGAHVAPTADEADPLVPEADEILGHVARGGAMIDVDGG